MTMNQMIVEVDKLLEPLGFKTNDNFTPEQAIEFLKGYTDKIEAESEFPVFKEQFSCDMYKSFKVAIEAIEFMRLHQCSIRAGVICDSDRCCGLDCLDLTEEDEENAECLE